MIHSDHDKHKSSKRTSSPANHSPEKSVKDKSQSISITEWQLYYKTLFSSSNQSNDSNCNELGNYNIFEKTDFKISEKEVLLAIKRLKRNKASGLDNILNEMLIFSQFSLIKILTKLFNDILITGKYPSLWKESYIIPIHKSGNSSDPDNYRGISITSNMSKLFNSVLNQRLTDHFHVNNCITENQFGFKKGYRTSDNIFVMKTLTDKYLDRNEKLYACFIDFKKAFDSINHGMLMEKLRKTNIGSSMYNLLHDLYLNQQLNVQVKIGDLLSNKFTCEKGVRQGDSLSPLLFNLYINDVLKYLNPASDDPCIGTKHISCLFYADDLVLLSTSKCGLQQKINNLASFCTENAMSINRTKTKILVFNRAGKKSKDSFKLINDSLECCQSYRYLGVTLQCNGRFNNTFTDLSNRASKAIFKLKRMFNGNVPSFDTCIHLFDSMVKPILSYGSDIWGAYLFCDNMKKFDYVMKNQLEKVHQSFLKYSMGLNRYCPLIGLYGETGRYPLANMMLKNSMKYLIRVKDMEIDSLLYQCYDNCKLFKTRYSMWSQINKVLSLHANVQTPNISIQGANAIKNTLNQGFRTYWLSALHNDSKTANGNKLRNYRLYKTSFHKEKYLEHNDFERRQNLGRLRLSCHKLFIETGRHVRLCERLAPEDRLCQYCTAQVCEDELHFIMHCSNYTILRKKLLDNIHSHYQFLSDYSIEECYLWIMSSNETYVTNELTEYVKNAFKKRAISEILS